MALAADPFTAAERANTSEGVAEAVRCRFYLPFATILPNQIQLPAPQLGNDIEALSSMLAKDTWAVFLGPFTNAVLKPLRRP